MRLALRAGALFAGVVLISIAVATLRLEPPQPSPGGAPAAGFSAERAMADVRQIAQRPHPIGSADSIRVRAYLVQRLQALGLRTTVRSAAALRKDGSGVLAHNILGVLPGTEPALPAIVLMSHYDSVPTGPGAGDDAAGVAASLEIVRALIASGPRRRDVMVLITDGEEAGLLGAKAFFGADPERERFGLILNMEARGDSGRAVMFETHPRAGPLIAHLAGRGALTGASSLMPDLYRRLPNDTDLSEAIRAGRQGMNFAFFGGQANYHRPTDTAAALNPSSVQHLGDQALAAARALVDLPVLPPLGSDQVYADLLGGTVVRYPAGFGWWVLAAAAALGGLAMANARPLALSLAAGAGLFVAALLTSAVALLAAGRVLAAPEAVRALLQAYPQALAGFALLAAGGALIPLALGQRLRRRPIEALPAWLGALGAGLLLGVALQIWLPLGAFMVSWPLLAAAAAAALVSQGSRPASALAVVLIALALAQVFYWAGLMFTLVGVGAPLILTGFVGLATLLLMPLALPAMAGRLATFACVDLMVVGGGVLAWAVWG